MLNKTCNDFIDELGSNAPVPGGGSCAALVAALGAALGTMVGELTTGKKTYACYQEEITSLLEKTRSLTEEMKQSVQKDIDAFYPLSEVYRMPSSTEEEKAARETALQLRLYDAAEAPLELCEQCCRAMKLFDRLAVVGSRLAVSDVGCGVSLCAAALKSAKLNVLINLKSMKDPEQKAGLQARLDKAAEEGLALAEKIYRNVEEGLCQQN